MFFQKDENKAGTLLAETVCDAPMIKDVLNLFGLTSALASSINSKIRCA